MRPQVDGQTSTFPDPALLTAEVREIHSVAANVFGYHALELNAWEETPPLLATAQTISRHRLTVAPSGTARGPWLGHLFDLPVINEGLALVVMHHVHELHGSSYDVLSELHRVLQPEGIAVIVGFNPWRRGDAARACGLNPVGPRKLVERFKAFDLKTLLVRPIGPDGGRTTRYLTKLSRRWTGMTWLGHMGHSYLLVARKSSRPARIVHLRRLGLTRLNGRQVSPTSTFAERRSSSDRS
ncbi:MAG: hypothetical protein QNJ40_05200 [Xanthomonadales bacterium]|nr:hypothetical protein [Xanthomonadales bacterium]